jgi:Xaa-Pro aminopeptidase
MATAARLTDDGIWKAFGLAKPGESELEVGYKVMLEILKNGCQAVPSLLLGTGEGARALGAPTERRLKVGDIVRLDLNSLYRGYYCDMGRMAVVGKPSAEQTKAYSDLLGLKKRILEFMRPGRNCGEVHAFCVEQAKRMDLKLFVYPYIGIGHTTGVNNDEFPKLNVGFEKWALEPGMIFDVEPDTIGPEGEVFHSEDMVLVTNDGVEVITQSEGHDWSELLVIPA